MAHPVNYPFHLYPFNTCYSTAYAYLFPKKNLINVPFHSPFYEKEVPFFFCVINVTFFFSILLKSQTVVFWVFMCFYHIFCSIAGAFSLVRKHVACTRSVPTIAPRRYLSPSSIVLDIWLVYSSFLLRLICHLSMLSIFVSSLIIHFLLQPGVWQYLLQSLSGRYVNLLHCSNGIYCIWCEHSNYFFLYNCYANEYSVSEITKR